MRERKKENERENGGKKVRKKVKERDNGGKKERKKEKERERVESEKECLTNRER